MKNRILFLLILLAMVSQALADDINLVDCSGVTSCTVSTFRADVPELFSKVTLSLVQPLPIGTNHMANVDLDGMVTAIYCNNTWQNLPSDSPVLQNQIRCTVDNQEPNRIIADVIIYDQTTFAYPQATQPSTMAFTYLAGSSSSTPYCVSETSPDSATACQWEAQENGAWVIYAQTRADQVLIGKSTGSGGGGGVPITGDICINNTDGNSYIDPWEWGQCPYVDNSTTDQICLLDAVACIDSTSTPICLDGGTLNTVNDQCEVPSQNVSCPSMYTYNQGLDLCEREPYCEDGGVFNGIDDRCEIVVSGSCPQGYTFDPVLDACTHTPACQGSGLYDPTTDQCTAAIIQSCNSPSIFNTSTGLCENNPCASWGSFNASAQACLKNATPICPLGYSMSGSICIRSPVCPSGGQYNSTANRCEAVASTGTCKPKGYLAHLRTTPYNMSNCPYSSAGQTGSSDIVLQKSMITGKDIVYYQNAAIPHDTNTTNLTNIVAQKTIVKCLFMMNGGDYYRKEIYVEELPGFECVEKNTVLGTYSNLQQCQVNCGGSNSCPAGYSISSSSLCISNPSCPNGGTLNGTTDRCEIQTIPSCDSGAVYDTVLNACVKPPCDAGYVFNTSTGLCEIAPIVSCPASYTLSGNICTSPPVCGSGSYNPVEDLCMLQAASLCPQTYTYDSVQDLCYAPYYCFNQSVFSSTANVCLLQADHTCPGSYSYNIVSRLCEAFPVCQAGSYRKDTDDCYVGNNICPYGPMYACKPYNGVNLCSPHQCVDATNNETPTSNETTTGSNDKEDDGTVDSAGNCLGNIYIYNGKDSRCRSWGVTLYFAGCCNSDTYLMGTMDCDSDEKMLSMKKSKGLCHPIGEYDSKKISMGFTDIVTEKKKTYCCFNSKLSRIIHEQGRPQLIAFSQEGWGTPEKPNCRGFTPEEFQMIKFEDVDMSEWNADIQVEAVDAIQSDIQKTIQTSVNVP